MIWEAAQGALVGLAIGTGLYWAARWLGNGRCWHCRRLCAPWSVYCRRCLP